MILKLTNKLLYDIRKIVEESGYPANCGKNFWLISPVITEFHEKLDVVVLTEKEGYEILRVIKRLQRLPKKKKLTKKKVEKLVKLIKDS